MSEVKDTMIDKGIFKIQKVCYLLINDFVSVIN